MDYYEIYISIASVATIAITGLLVLALMYAISILHDVKRLSKIAKKEAEIIARGIEGGASALGGELSREAAGFVKMVFALLLSQFGTERSRKVRKSKTANT